MAEQSGFLDNHVEFPPGQFISLQSVDEATKCAICCAIFNTPLLLHSCGHSFCAACIRQSIDFQERSGQPVCPSCRKPCDSRDLLPNLALRHLIELYTTARPEILGLVHTSIQQQQQQHKKSNKKSTIEETQQEQEQQEQQQLRRSSRRKSSQPMDGDDNNTPNGGRGNPRITKGTTDNRKKRVSTQRSSRRRRRSSPSSSLHQHDEDDDEKEHGLDPDFVVVDLTGGSPSGNNNEWSDDSGRDSENENGNNGSPDGSLGKRKRRKNTSTKRKSQPTKHILPSDTDAGTTHINNNSNKAGVGAAVPKNFVQCPICSKTVPEFYINSHVDSCLRRSQNGDVPSPSQALPLPSSRLGPGLVGIGVVCHNYNKNNGKEADASMPINPEKSFQLLPVPPKLAPALATDKSLRGMLKKYGLPVEGKKPELLDRYNKFRLTVELANDRGEPTSYDQLAKKVMKMAASTERQKPGLLAPLLLQGREGHHHHHNSRPSSSSGGGGGMLQHPSSSLGAAFGGGGPHDNSIPLTGYSFKELIEVARKRDAARKARLAQQQQQQQSEEDERQQEQDVCTSQPRNNDEDEGKKPSPQLENMQNNRRSTAATNAEVAIHAKNQLVEETLMGIDPEELDDWGI